MKCLIVLQQILVAVAAPQHPFLNSPNHLFWSISIHIHKSQNFDPSKVHDMMNIGSCTKLRYVQHLSHHILRIINKESRFKVQKRLANNGSAIFMDRDPYSTTKAMW